MIVSNNFAVPYYLNVRKEKGMTAYYWATHQSQLALFDSYELAYRFYFPSALLHKPTDKALFRNIIRK
ncbi:hypothetical protein V2W63_22285 [Acinetobacter baumannii]|nr:hypothetical protein [Acinetobacter baumannii]MCG6641438.1 hypothetical protein [Acinetobacter baumannii]PPC26893.1 hypothetical protein AbaMCR8676_16000 [Acinetobacter baumannii]PPC55658.1 hypothetical protein AbaMCR56_16355 [Acinetobacter baumannii]